MRADFSTLLWLKRKKIKDISRYWLPLMGFDDEDSSPFYLLYVLGFWMIWVFAMWGFIIEQVYQGSRIMPDDLQAAIPEALPFFMVILYVIYLLYAIFNDPLKFNAPDIAYLVTSPASRAVILLLYFVQALLIPAMILSVGAALLAMLLAWSNYPQEVGVAGLEGAILAGLSIYSLAGWAWIMSLLRRIYSNRIMPLIPVFVVVIAVCVFIIGQLWVQSIDAVLSGQVVLIALMLLLITLVVLGWLSNHVHLTTIADRSQTYAQIQRMGIFGRVYARSLIDRIHRQSRLIRKKRLHHTLISSDDPIRTLFYRALLSLSRFSPGRILTLISQGAFLTLSILSLTSTMGWRPFQVWLMIIIMFVARRPSGLIGTFGQDMGQVFLVQFLPRNRLLIFMTASFFPILLAIWGGLVVIVMFPTVNTLAMIALLIVTTIALALCQGLEYLKDTSIAYEHSILAYGVFVIGAGYLSESLWIALLAACIFVGIATTLLDQ